jgi:hypothetical protein
MPNQSARVLGPALMTYDGGNRFQGNPQLIHAADSGPSQIVSGEMRARKFAMLEGMPKIGSF